MSNDPSVQVREIQLDGEIALVLAAPVGYRATVTIEAQLTHMRSSKPLPLTVATLGRPLLHLTSFKRSGFWGGYNYPWQYRWQYGEPMTGNPAPFKYARPYRGTRALLQGPYGTFSHQRGGPDEQAYDFELPFGEPIYAAREGTVCAVRGDLSEGGLDPNLRANYVVVRHDDGTFAEYLHIQHNGVRVSLGERVTPDTILGLAGSVGHSTGPHVHFCVFRVIDGKRRESLVVEFA